MNNKQGNNGGKTLVKDNLSLTSLMIEPEERDKAKETRKEAKKSGKEAQPEKRKTKISKHVKKQ